MEKEENTRVISIYPPSCLMVDVSNSDERARMFEAADIVFAVNMVYPKFIETDEDGNDVEEEYPLGYVRIRKEDDSNVFSVSCVAKRAGDGSVIPQAFKIAMRNALRTLILDKSGSGKGSVLIYIRNDDLEPHAIYEYTPSNMALDISDIISEPGYDDAANFTIVLATDPSSYPLSLFDIDDDDDDWDDDNKKKKKKKKKNKKNKK